MHFYKASTSPFLKGTSSSHTVCDESVMGKGNIGGLTIKIKHQIK